MPDLLGQPQQPVEHGRHHVGVGDAVLLDQLERVGRVPSLHEHHAHAVGQRHGERVDQRAAVVQRAGAQVPLAGAGLVPGRVGEPLEPGRVVRRAQHALGSAGGARGVEHPVAQHRVVEVLAELAAERGLVGLEAVDLSADRPARTDRRDSPAAASASTSAKRGVADHRPGPAVLDDVADLVGGEVPVDRACSAARCADRRARPRRTRAGWSRPRRPSRRRPVPRRAGRGPAGRCWRSAPRRCVPRSER